MSDVLVLQNNIHEDLGLFKAFLEKDGFNIKQIQAWKESIPESDYTLLIILGGPQSANDNLQYLINEQKLVQNFAQKNKLVLGICLGSQLVAKALGSKVYKGDTLEFGFYNDIKPTIQGKENLFAGFDDPFLVYHWHNDTFTLPPDAKLIASSDTYQNQAFILKNIIGLQFHLEPSITNIQTWTDTKLDNTQLDLAKKLESNLGLFYKNFKANFL